MFGSYARSVTDPHDLDIAVEIDRDDASALRVTQPLEIAGAATAAAVGGTAKTRRGGGRATEAAEAAGLVSAATAAGVWD
jgi:hypothetical protein